MNAERLLQLYDRVSEAPDAIPRLRRFVLDLAVRGKLVEQDPEDEAAPLLLKAIYREKKRLIADGVIRNPRSLADQHEATGPFQLPPTWLWTRLDTVGAIIGGGTPPAGDSTNFIEPGGGIPWLTPADLGGYDKEYISRGSRDLTEKGLASSSATLMPTGAVLFTSRAPIGYVAIALNPLATNQGFKSIVPYVGECSRYIAVAMRAFAPKIDASAPGTTFKEVSGKIVAGIPFPLAPLAEQHRIVAKVDELMALCDSLEAEREKREASRDRLTTASLSRLTVPDVDENQFKAHADFAIKVLPELTTRPDQIKVLRQTILDLAVRGKLVEQDPKDETGYELLKRLSARRDELGKEHRRRRTSLPNEINDDERYLSLPASWTWARLFQLGETQTGTSPSSSNPLYFGHFVPFVKPGNLDGVRITYDGMGLSETGMSRSRVARKGSVLMVCIGATLGKVNVAEETVCFNQQINSVTPFLDGLHAFVALALKASSFQRLAWSRAGTGTLPIISKGKWEILPVPLPPLAEQQRIVTKVKDLMNTCEQVETNLAVCEQTQGHLLNALLVETLGPGTLDAA